MKKKLLLSVCVFVNQLSAMEISELYYSHNLDAQQVAAFEKEFADSDDENQPTIQYQGRETTYKRLREELQEKRLAARKRRALEDHTNRAHVTRCLFVEAKTKASVLTADKENQHPQK